MEHCAPHAVSHKKKQYGCLPKAKLVELAQQWNRTHPEDEVRNPNQMTSNELWKKLHEKLRAVCGGRGELCWARKLKIPNQESLEQFFRPEMPSVWSKNKFTWVTNYDIEPVMRQYENVPELNYKFLGVMPVDFASKDTFGECLYRAMCTDLVRPMYQKGIRHFGAIFNLDKHNQSGSHWVSLLVCMDTKHPMFGIYYYDSNARPPPREIEDFMMKIKSQWEAFMIGVPIPVKRNQKRHQFGNSECGMFSMVFQIFYLELLRMGDKYSFDDYLALPIDDDMVNKFRQIIFRPPTVGGKGGVPEILPV